MAVFVRIYMPKVLSKIFPSHTSMYFSAWCFRLAPFAENTQRRPKEKLIMPPKTLPATLPNTTFIPKNCTAMMVTR